MIIIKSSYLNYIFVHLSHIYVYFLQKNDGGASSKLCFLNVKFSEREKGWML